MTSKKSFKNKLDINDKPDFLKGFSSYIIIFLIVTIIYAHTIFFNFTYLDDNKLILDNFYFLSDISNILKAFQQDVFINTIDNAYYRPIMNISLMLDAQFSGTSPFFYHLTNILIHLFCVFFVFSFLLKLGYKRFPSFLFSVFFAVHPALCQAVAWIPGRNDSLLTLFILLSFIFFINYMSDRKINNLFIHLLFFAFALFTKETTLISLFLFIFYIRLISLKRVLQRQNISLFLGWIIITYLWFVMRKSALPNPINYSPKDMINSIVSNLPAVFLYIGKTLLPFNLSVLPTLNNNTLIYGYIVVAVSIFLICLSKNINRLYITFGILWFLSFLLPAFIRPDPNLPTAFIEHRMYLPFIGFMIFLLEAANIKNIVFGKNFATFLCISILLLFSLINIFYSYNFKDQITFWENARNHSPQYPLARRNLGAIYYLKGDFDKAKEEYLECVKLNPAEPMVHNNLGLIYMNRGEFKKAEDEFLTELKYNPNYDTAYYNLGLLYLREGRIQQSINLWKKTIDINPYYFDAYEQLAALFYILKDYNQSAFYINQAKKRNGKINPQLLKAMESIKK